MENDTIFALWLLIKGGVASDTNYKALKIFASFEKIYNAKLSDFPQNIFSADEIKKFLDKDLSEAKKVYEYCIEKEISIFTFFSKNYPPLLREIPRPPILLFCRGTLPNFFKEPPLTVVGSRKCNIEYGKIASKICYELAIGNFIIISGIADGADTFAHKGALMAKGKSVAVLPCGVDIDYSYSSSKIKKFILQKGALISEYLPGTHVRRYHFEQRNRILSGISPATLVVCAEKNSGTMITVKHATEQGKYIFALPGNPTSKISEGTNELLRSGAILCRNSMDIFDEYGNIFDGKLMNKNSFIKNIEETRKILIENKDKYSEFPSGKKSQKPNKKESASKITESQTEKILSDENKPEKLLLNLSDEQKEIYSILKKSTLSADNICSLLSQPFSEVIVKLQEMAIDGIIEEKSGGQWSIKQ